MRRAGALAAAALAAATAGLHGQRPGQLAGVVRDGTDGAPLAGAEVLLEGRPAAVTDGEGRFVVRRPPQAATLHVRRIGYAFAEVPVAPADTLVEVRLAPVAYVLPELVARPGTCTRPGLPADAPPSLVVLAAQVRLNGERSRAFVRAHPFEAEWLRVTALTVGSRPVAQRETVREASRAWIVPFAPGRVARRRGRSVYVAPLWLGTLGDDGFWREHCVRAAGSREAGGRVEVLLAFEPLSTRTAPGWSGVIALDAATSLPVTLDWVLARPSPSWGLRHLSGTTTYRELYPAFAVPDSTRSAFWYERDPVPGSAPDELQVNLLAGLAFRAPGPALPRRDGGGVRITVR